MLHFLETDVLNDGGVDPKEAEHRKYTKAADINKFICIIKLNMYYICVHFLHTIWPSINFDN